MKMANHPRPGDIIQEALDELNVSLREFARAMEIAPSTASRLLTGKAALTPEMAIKLSVVIGSSPEMWLNLQIPGVWHKRKKAWTCPVCAVWRCSNRVDRRTGKPRPAKSLIAVVFSLSRRPMPV